MSKRIIIDLGDDKVTIINLHLLPKLCMVQRDNYILISTGNNDELFRLQLKTVQRRKTMFRRISEFLQSSRQESITINEG